MVGQGRPWANPALREKHVALPFGDGKVQSEILRSAQNDSMAGECTDITLASATVPVQLSGAVSAGFALSPQCLPEADSVSLDK